MMKRILSAVVLLMILCLPAAAVSAPLQFGSPDMVYSIDAAYAVKDSGVQTVNVTFDKALSNAYANYADGVLKVAIASADPLDLYKAVGTATATLSDGTMTAPTLELTSLRFNGKKASSSLVLASAEAVLSNDVLSVTLTAAEYNPAVSHEVIIAAYDSAGRMVASAVQTIEFSSKSVTDTFPLVCTKTAETVKVFCMDEALQPLTACLTISVK